MLHTDEIEIIIPDKIHEGDETPMLLSIGPTFTMAIPILLMLCFGNRIYGENSGHFLMMTVITGGSTCVMGIIWGISLRLYKKSSLKKKINKQLYDYQKYISDKHDYLLFCKNENVCFYNESYPNAKEIVEKELNVQRNIDSAEAFLLRLGLGRRDFDVKIKKQNNRKEMFKSKYELMADDLIEEFSFIENVPVTVDLALYNKLALIGDKNSDNTYSYIKTLLIYLISAYRPSDVKIALIFDENNNLQRKLYELFKFMPHAFAYEDKRLLAGNNRDLSYILPSINTEESDMRIIFFVLDEKPLLGDILYDYLFEKYDDRTKVISLFNSQKDVLHRFNASLIIPPECSSNGSLIYGNSIDLQTLSFKTDDKYELDDKQIDSYIRQMFRKKDIINNSYVSAPMYVDFMEMYGVDKVEDIDILHNWYTNHPEERIKVPIGIGENNKHIYLDLHEKFHGPHGLIAGTTGSGKSELLQTYLISLCINFSPQDINFFLIDYKGGGTGNVIKNLPHCAGTISNLSGRNIKRAMSAIKSENLRRQKILSEYGVNHIDSYMELYRQGMVNSSMPHLLLIIDEFAELKKEEPEFMKEIISLAAVGRSLGIHLILATQKPAGVVDDKIWSNSRFKLCLKVQDKMDSMDMLHRKEAAYLTRSGQCYFQIGNDEYFTYFQTAYCGGKNTKQRGLGNKVSLVKRSGERILYRDKNEYEGSITQLEAMTNYVNRIASTSDYNKAKSLWIDELDDCILQPDIMDINTDSEISFNLGVYDNPGSQMQDRMFYIPKRDGHFIIAGMPGCGKTNLLKIILSQMQKCRYVIADIGGDSFISFSKDNNCLGLFYDSENMDIFFYNLRRLYRKYEEPVFIIIDNFSKFYRNLSEENSDFIKKIIDEGISKNIYCIFTGNIVSDFPSRIFSKVRTTLCMEMNDRFQYGDICRQYNLDIYPKGGTPGRCLYRIGEKILEGQIYKLRYEVMSTNRSNVWGIPDKPYIEDMIEEYVKSDYYDKNIIPIGYSLKSGLIRGVRIKCGSIFIISGLAGTGKHTLFDNIKKYISKIYTDTDERLILLKNINDLKTVSDIDSKFIIALFDQTKDSEILHNSIYANYLSRAEGVHLGGNTSQQRILDFSDIPYSAANIKTPPGYGLLKLSFKNNTMKIRIPMNKKEVNEDDYD